MHFGIERAARTLLEARRTGNLLDAMPPDAMPRTVDEGYAIQQAVTEQWPDRVAGWKIGATSKEIQALFGISEPIYGPVFAKTVFDSPVRVAAGDFPHRLIETEFAFRFARDLPARSTAYTRDEIIEAIDALLPSFEIVNPRFASVPAKNIPLFVADFCANGGAVLGEPIANWRTLDLTLAGASLAIDGVERQRGTGALSLGDPIKALEWFVDAFSKRGQTLRTGQFVMTGTMTGLHAPAVGQLAKSTFDHAGAIEMVFV